MGVAVLGTRAGRPPPLRRRLSGTWLTTVVGLAAVVAAWELLARTALEGRHLIAAPTDMVSAVADHANLYARAVRFTLVEAAWGYLWGNLAAITLAAFVALAPFT